MDKVPDAGNKRSPSRSMRSTTFLSRVLMNKQKKTNSTKKINKNNNKNKNNKNKNNKNKNNNKNRNNNNNNISDEDLLFIQNEFTPSNMATNLTDEKIYNS